MHELRDGPVEQLVGGAPRLEHVAVDATQCHRPEHRIGGLAVGPVAPADQEPAFRVGVDLAHVGQQFGAGRVGEPLVGQDHRDVGVLCPEVVERGDGLVAGAHAQDAVIGPEAAGELAGDPGELILFIVDCEDDGSARSGVVRRGHGPKVL